MPSDPRFSPTQRLQRAYAQGIRRIVGRVLAPKLPEQSLDEWLADIARRSRAQDVREASDLLARRMVGWADVRNARTWREAAARSQQSRQLYTLLQKEMEGTTGLAVSRLVAENAHYISSLPLTAATTLVDEVRKAQQAGSRPETVTKMMRSRFPELIRSRVHLISRTETSKASAALTEARAEELNLPCYVWRTSKDARVRDSHRLMDGVVVFYSQPPAPEALDGLRSTLGHYHAGQAPNDRCYQEVVLGLDALRFPIKVYWGGAIKHMSKQEFRQIATQLEVSAA